MFDSAGKPTQPQQSQLSGTDLAVEGVTADIRLSTVAMHVIGTIDRMFKDEIEFDGSLGAALGAKRVLHGTSAVD